METKEDLIKLHDEVSDKVSHYNADFTYLRGDGRFFDKREQLVSPYQVLQKMQEMQNILNDVVNCLRPYKYNKN